MRRLQAEAYAEGKHEFEHLVGQLQGGAIWAIIIIAGYLFLLAWWG